jgi:hypothetical protein
LALAGLVMLASLQCAPRAVTRQQEAAQAIRRGMESGRGVFDHASFSRVLETYARDMGSRFDYEGLKAHPEDLRAYVVQVGGADLASLSRDELLALLINAYNAFTLESILDTLTPDKPRGPASIRDIPQVFSRKTHRIGGYSLSLDDLEHGLIRPLFKDPRAYFVMNRASLGCPPLPTQALTGTMLDSQLEYAARRTLSSPDYVRVEDGRLLVTKLLDWYGVDFVAPDFHGAEKSLALYIRKYASDEVARLIDARGGNPEIGFLDYNWSLNRATRQPLQDTPF